MNIRTKLNKSGRAGLLGLAFLIGVTASATTFAESGGFQRPPPMTAAQKQAFEACLKQQNVPLPPKPSASDKAAFKACKQTVAQGDHEAFMACLTGKGVTPPPRPTQEQMAAYHQCHQTAMEAGNQN